MTRTIFCVKLQREAEGLGFVPYPGELGQRIYANVSKEGWQLWMGYQTKLINEYRLSLIDPQAKTLLEKEMEKFFFGETEKQE